MRRSQLATKRVLALFLPALTASLFLLIAPMVQAAPAKARKAPAAAKLPDTPAVPAKDPLAVELDRRADALVKAGYNLTQSFSWRPLSAANPIRFEFFVPAPGEIYRFSFWADAGNGAVDFRLLAPDGKAIASWQGRSGEQTLSLEAPVGRYQLQLDPVAGADGRALFGVRGPAVAQCELKEGELKEHPAARDNSFRFPYLLWTPKNLAAKRLLVLPINTGFVTEDVALLRASASCEIASEQRLAERLGTPILIPLFPRPSLPDDQNLYVHALSRATLQTRIGVLRRIDLQLLAMVDDALADLKKRRLDFDAKILLFGFSAAGSFASRFAMLHPERVLAVASGSPGGWPIAPATEVDGENLTYPVGIADLQALVGDIPNPSSLRRVSWLFLLGDADDNDAVPHRDSFSKEDEELIDRRFGKTPVSRWKAAEKFYERAEIPARFTLYKGEGHAMSAAMNEDVAKFFEAAAGGNP